MHQPSAYSPNTRSTAAMFGQARVALETTLLVHGVPRDSARALAKQLEDTVRREGAEPALVGVVAGKPTVGMTSHDLDTLLSAPPSDVTKVNSANLGVVMLRGAHGATTVSTTMELASRAGVSVFATGGIGGVHPMPSSAPTNHLPLDISSDLFAFTRFPVAVVTSGVKSILDIAATRELLETLGVPVIGFTTTAFPAFYLRQSPTQRVGDVDARFDDVREMARFVRHELARTGRGVVVCNPIPLTDEISKSDWANWLDAAMKSPSVLAQHAGGRDVTPALLAALHQVSGGATLRANIALVNNNARVAAMLARAMTE
jgi:pseudouridylate synthase